MLVYGKYAHHPRENNSGFGQMLVQNSSPILINDPFDPSMPNP
jgi:hypothetical protein